MEDLIIDFEIKNMLEPYVLKGTRTVLRREGGSNPIPDLSDYIKTIKIYSSQTQTSQKTKLPVVEHYSITMKIRQ